MKLIQWTDTDAYFNLAAEEYIFQNMDKQQDYAMLWQNRNAVIIGKHQNTIEEVNQDFVLDNDIQVVRRQSGGGAVYHDLGNLNYSFVINTQTSLYDFKALSQPIVQALREFGVEVDFTGRNDLVLDGKKISGVAQMIKQGRLLHHGTLLFNSNLGILERVLAVKQAKIESKGIKSIRSRVTNICEHAPEVTIEQFKTAFAKTLASEQEVELYQFSEQDRTAITTLADKKYSTWDWNYGQSPEYNIKKDYRFDGGGLSIYLQVNKGVIQSMRIFGDYFGEGEIVDIENRLRSVKINEEEVKAALADFNVSFYIHGLDADKLAKYITA
jgi:lipoate-protein ligase A